MDLSREKPSKNTGDQYVAKRGKGNRQDPAGYKESADDVASRIMVENYEKRVVAEARFGASEALKGKRDRQTPSPSETARRRARDKTIDDLTKKKGRPVFK